MSRFAKFLLDRIDDHMKEVPEPTASHIRLHLSELRAIVEEGTEEPQRRTRRGNANA